MRPALRARPPFATGPQVIVEIDEDNVLHIRTHTIERTREDMEREGERRRPPPHPAPHSDRRRPLHARA